MGVEQAVVLAAGEGRRLRPLTKHRPKPMLPAANRPLLEYVLDALVDTGITTIHIVVGYNAARVQDHFGSQYRDTTIEYVHQDKQLGSGHALFQAESSLDGWFLVVNGDQICSPRIITDVMARVDTDESCHAVLGVLERDELGVYGAVELDDDRVTEFHENPDPGTLRWLNAGVYAFDTEIFEVLNATPRREGELPLPDAIGELLQADQTVCGVRTNGLWIDATYPWDLLTMTRKLLDTGWIDMPAASPEVWVADSASIHASAVLDGPVVIGPETIVGPGAIVGPNTALGRNVTVGANSVVTRSVLDGDTRVAQSATLVDAVLGQRVRLGAGTVIPGGRSTVTVAGEVHDRQQLGAVLADRVTTEGAVRVAPGTLIGPNSVIHAGADVTGTIPENAEVV